MLATLTGLGLSAAAGLNAYIPLLLVGVLARWTEVVTLPPDFAWIQNEWVLGAVAVLASYFPARRASRIPPVEALRYQ